MRFPHFFIERPIFAAVLSILIVIVGAIAYPTLPVAQYPEIAPPTVVVSATYPGASAETLAYAVATGNVGDPRSFKRPVRVTVPRALPTDDVLILRDKKGTGEAEHVMFDDDDNAFTTGWHDDDNDDMTECCSTCGLRLPEFAMIAHQRFHLEPVAERS